MYYFMGFLIWLFFEFVAFAMGAYFMLDAVHDLYPELYTEFMRRYKARKRR